jgi:hypothetical protein
LYKIKIKEKTMKKVIVLFVTVLLTAGVYGAGDSRDAVFKDRR